MAWTLRNTASVSGNATCNKPAGTLDGDLLIAFACTGQTGQAITAPSGGAIWVAMGTAISGGLSSSRCFYKIASGEGASYAFGSIAGFQEIAIFAYSAGFDTTTPFDTASGKFEGSNTSTPTSNSITTARDGNLVLVFFSESNANGAFAPPSGMTEELEWDADSEIASLTQGSAGSTGTKQATVTGASPSWQYHSWIMSMNAPAASGLPPGLGPVVEMTSVNQAATLAAMMR